MVRAGEASAGGSRRGAPHGRLHFGARGGRGGRAAPPVAHSEGIQSARAMLRNVATRRDLAPAKRPRAAGRGSSELRQKCGKRTSNVSLLSCCKAHWPARTRMQPAPANGRAALASRPPRRAGAGAPSRGKGGPSMRLWTPPRPRGRPQVVTASRCAPRLSRRLPPRLSTPAQPLLLRREHSSPARTPASELASTSEQPANDSQTTGRPP